MTFTELAGTLPVSPSPEQSLPATASPGAYCGASRKGDSGSPCGLPPPSACVALRGPRVTRAGVRHSVFLSCQRRRRAKCKALTGNHIFQPAGEAKEHRPVISQNFYQDNVSATFSPRGGLPVTSPALSPRLAAPCGRSTPLRMNAPRPSPQMFSCPLPGPRGTGGGGL